MITNIKGEKEFSDWLLDVADGRLGACFSNTQDPAEQPYVYINFNTYRSAAHRQSNTKYFYSFQ
jgi:hypothetical protein